MAEIIPDSNKQDISGFVTQKATSGKGQEYEIGRPEGSEEAENAQPDDAAPANVKVGLIWQPGQGDQQVQSDIKQKTGISSYRIDTGGFFYTYRLNITTTTSPRGYKFFDAAGDSYVLNSFRNGNHYVDYNSKGPNIDYVLVS